MTLHHRLFRSLDDDGAPIDYSYVPSVSEGLRRRQQQAIHEKKTDAPAPIVRHRAEPERPRVDSYGTRARVSAVPDAPVRDTVMKKLPSLSDGPAPARSIAYPEVADIPDDPFAPPETPRPPRPARPVRRSGASRPEVGNGADVGMRPQGGGNVPTAGVLTAGATVAANGRAARNGLAAGNAPTAGVPSADNAPAAGNVPSAGVLVAEDGSQFETPAKPEIPEWLRVAQQNHMPTERPVAPRVMPAPRVDEDDAPPPTDALGRPLRRRENVEAARRRAQGPLPQTAEEYAQAGYPPELLAQQEEWEREQARYALRKKHGAQHAIHDPRPTRPPRPSAQPQRMDYAPQAGRAADPYAPRAAYDLDTPVDDPYGSAYRGGPYRQDPYQAEAYAPDPYQGAYAPDPYAQAPAPARRAGRSGYAQDPYPQDPNARRRTQDPYQPDPYAQAPAPTRRAGRSGYAQDPYPQDPNARRRIPDTYQADPYAQDPYQPDPYAHDPYQVEVDEPEPSAVWQLLGRVPWLGVAAFVCALTAVLLWIAGNSYTRQTAQVLAARQAQESAVLESHPLKYQSLIEETAQRYNLSPAFVAAIIKNESSFRPDAESSVGARGLMQLMEDTAAWIYDRMGLSTDYSFDRMYDAQTNVEFGCWYLNYLSERFRGDPVLVAASFHAGQGEVQNWLNDSRYSADGLTIALEDMIDGPTRQYATRVLNDFAAYKRLYYEPTGG